MLCMLFISLKQEGIIALLITLVHNYGAYKGGHHNVIAVKVNLNKMRKSTKMYHFI